MLFRHYKTKRNDSVATPKWILDFVAERWQMAAMFDPCPIGGTNGLTCDWQQHTFVNPPFSALSQWLAKAYNEVVAGHCATVVLLVPFRPQCRYWDDWVYGKASAVHVLTHPVRFVGYNDTYKHPLCMIEYTAGDHGCQLHWLTIPGWDPTRPRSQLVGVSDEDAGGL